MTQIDVWSAENEFGKAFSTLNYVKESHPQSNELQIRKKKLLTQATEYEQRIDKQVNKDIKNKKWAEALDLVDQAKEKYPLDTTENKNRILKKTEQNLLTQQQKALASINEKILLERSQWMIKTRPIFHKKLKTDPRNDVLKNQVANLDAEASNLSQKLTLLAQISIEKKHYKTAKLRINQAITLESNKSRQKTLSQLKQRSKNNYISHKKKQKKSQDQAREIQQSSLLKDIERSYNSGDFLKTRQLISQLDDTEKNDTQLIQLKQELDRSINYKVQRLMSGASKNYTDGQFHQAIELWQQVLMYEPENVTAKKNIKRSEKVINKLTILREKQNN